MAYTRAVRSPRKTQDERKPLGRCYARQEQDEMVCWTCGGLRWGIDEDKPPAARCLKDKAR